VLLGKGAAGTAIFAEGDVHVGENSSLSLVSATGRVELGRGAQADLVIGEEVVLCEQSVVGKVCASGDLTVRSGARLGDACALRRIALERAVSLSSWSLICPNGEIAFDSGVTLHGVLVDPSNSFWIGRDGQLMYQRDLEQCGMVVTALMNHELLSAIHELTPCRATIHG
jgi:carbonic anhydrase/acetyltransferase-like protein (isoleucine patch superfamily)